MGMVFGLALPNNFLPALHN